MIEKERIKLLPLWCVADKYPAFFDTESATAIEMVAKLYGSMRTMQEDYNNYVTEINETITAFINDVNSDQECFINQINKIVHDYIAMIDEKIKLQDQIIEDNITYIKENIIDGIKQVLGQMVESGELDEIILNSFNDLNSRVLNLEKTRTVKNIVEMKALENLTSGIIIKTIGYYSADDGGGATYLIREKAETDIEDNGAIHFINDSLVAEFISENYINVKQFGAKGDNVNDDTIFIQNAINYVMNNIVNKKVLSIMFDSGVYKITNTIILNYYTRLISNGLVKIIFETPDSTCFKYEYIEKPNSPFSQNFFQSPLIDGSNGCFTFVGDIGNKTNTCFEFGQIMNTDENKTVLKNGFRFVEIEGFKIGMKYDVSHNYLTEFNHIGFRNNITALQVGFDNPEVISGENVTFTDCTFGGNGYSIYINNSIPLKFVRCSFDMNNSVLFTNPGGGRYEFYQCWIERNGITNYVNRIPDSDRSIMLNKSTENYTDIIIRDCYSTYGGVKEGETLTNHLFQGKFIIDEINYMWDIGVDFYDGTKKRLFIYSDDVEVRRKNENSGAKVMIPSYKTSTLKNGMFENTSAGSISTNVGDTFGIFKVVDKVRVTGEILSEDNNELFSDKKKVRFSTTGGGFIRFETTDFHEFENGNFIRPFIIFKQIVESGLTPESGMYVYVQLFDGNQNQIGSDIAGDYIKTGQEFSYGQMLFNKLIDSNAKYYKLKVFLYFNNDSLQQHVDFYGLLNYFY